jgi:hypothetical protein
MTARFLVLPLCCRRAVDSGGSSARVLGIYSHGSIFSIAQHVPNPRSSLRRKSTHLAAFAPRQQHHYCPVAPDSSNCFRLGWRAPASIPNPWQGLWDCLPRRHQLQGRSQAGATLRIWAALPGMLSLRVRFRRQLDLGDPAGERSSLTIPSASNPFVAADEEQLRRNGARALGTIWNSWIITSIIRRSRTSPSSAERFSGFSILKVIAGLSVILMNCAKQSIVSECIRISNPSALTSRR